jgi:6-phosphogluconolactonase
VSPPQVLTHASPDELARTVAQRLVGVLADAQAAGRVPAVALTGGTVAARIHAALRDEAEGRLDWSRVDLWWGDERYVPSDDPDRNARQAADALLDHVGVDPSRVHVMPASDEGHRSLDEAAAAYGEQVRTHGAGRFDVVMLGVGPDGHVASLFPGFPQLDVDDTVAVAVTDAPKPPPDRISLTFGALNRTRAVWFVVSGAEKADAVARALATGEQAADVHDVPAVGVHGQEETVWFLDEGSASRLPTARR